MTTAATASKTRPKLGNQSNFFFLALVLVGFFVVWTIFKPYVTAMLAGVLIAVIALPIDRMWEKVWRKQKRGDWRDAASAFSTMFTIFLLIAGPVVGLGFALFNQVEALAAAIEDGSLEAAVSGALTKLLPGMTPEERTATVTDLWTNIQPGLETAVKGVLSGAVGWLGSFAIGFTIVLFVTYYVLTDGTRLTKWLRRAAPLPPRQVDRLLAEGHGGIKAVFFGQILTSLIQGALGGIGFLIAGLPGVILWAAVMAILSLIPVIGAFIVWIPAAIYLLATGQLWQGIFLAAWGAIVVGQVDNFIRPKLIGGRADIHPLFVLIGVLGGVAAFGFIGLFLGPLVVGIFVSILKVWESDYIDPDLLEDDEEDVEPVALESPSADATLG